MSLLNMALYTLGLMWAVGWPLAIISWAVSAWRDEYERSKVFPIILLLVGLPAATFISAIPWLIYWGDQSPTFTLHKDEWACVAQHNETVTTMVMIGKVMVPQTQIMVVCDTYNRR